MYKHRKTFPKLVLSQGWEHMEPAYIRQLMEEWISRVTLSISTWRSDAQKWWENMVSMARKDHEEWLDLNPADRARMEYKYGQGERIPIPESTHLLESVMRAELLEVIPAVATRSFQ